MSSADSDETVAGQANADETDQAILEALEEAIGSSQADLDRLIPVVYDELKKLAHGYLRGEPTTQTLQTTALVHEVYLKLVGRERLKISSRVQFFALAGHIMRRLLMDYGRKRRTAKRPKKELQVPITAILEFPQRPDLDLATLVTIDDTIRRFEALDPQAAQVVVLRFYCGLSNPEIAEYLGISESTIKRDWNTAKAWLARYLGADLSEGE